jgi:uncharacterized membrane-anchored protein
LARWRFVAAAYFRTKASRTLLFWVAFILTRPLAATMGDLLAKPFCAWRTQTSTGSAPRWLSRCAW